MAESAATIAQKLPFRNPVREHYEKAHSHWAHAVSALSRARVGKRAMPWMIAVFLGLGAILGVQEGFRSLAFLLIPLGVIFYLGFWFQEWLNAKSLIRCEGELERAEAALNEEVERLKLLEEQAG